MTPYPIQNLATVSGFKSRNPELDVSAWNDATVSGFISTATRSIQSYCNVDGFLSQTVSGEQCKAVISSFGDLIIYPHIRPLRQGGINALRLVKGGFTTNLLLSGGNQLYYNVPYPYTSFVYASSYLAATGTLLLGGSQTLLSLKGSGVYCELDYVGGYATVPEDLQDACDLWTRDIVTRRMNPMGAQDVQQGSFRFTRVARSSNPNYSFTDSVYVAQAKQLLDGGGYSRVAMGA
jgi:hypothetical protein